MEKFRFWIGKVPIINLQKFTFSNYSVGLGKYDIFAYELSGYFDLWLNCTTNTWEAMGAVSLAWYVSCAITSSIKNTEFIRENIIFPVGPLVCLLIRNIFVGAVLHTIFFWIFAMLMTPRNRNQVFFKRDVLWKCRKVETRPSTLETEWVDDFQYPF